MSGLRVLGGKFRSRKLAAPEGLATRPSASRVRETLFNILRHRYGLPGLDTHVLDLFAGSGALGIEALSLGARSAIFVDKAAPARHAIHQNLQSLDLLDCSKLLTEDAATLKDWRGADRPNLIFIDPPYGQGLGEKVMASLPKSNWLAPDAIIVLEESAEFQPFSLAGLSLELERQIAKTKLHFYRAES